MASRAVYNEIAGLSLEVRGSAYLRERMADYGLCGSARACDCRIAVTPAAAIARPKGRAGAETRLWKLVQTAEGDAAYRVLSGCPDVVSARMDFKAGSAEISILSMEAGDCEGRDFSFAGQAFSQLMLERERMVLHGSCIAYRDRAVVFTAPSGTGKSTHTGLWMEHVPGTVYINDDTPVIRLDREDGVLACGSPWSGKTRLNANISAPLSAVIFLERGSENEIRPLPPLEALGRLLGEVRKLPFRRSVEQAAELCGRLVQRVPAYRLRCDISYGAVEAVRRELSL